MLSQSIFSKKELIAFIEETKYLNFITLIKKEKFRKGLKKIINLKGIFFIKGIFIIISKVKSLIIKELKSTL